MVERGEVKGSRAAWLRRWRGEAPDTLSPFIPFHVLAHPSPQQEEFQLEEEEEVTKRGGEGRREDPHLSFQIPLDPDPRVSFPTFHDPLRFCK
jgi:hypothetical protein